MEDVPEPGPSQLAADAVEVRRPTCVVAELGFVGDQVPVELHRHAPRPPRSWHAAAEGLQGVIDVVGGRHRVPERRDGRADRGALRVRAPVGRRARRRRVTGAAVDPDRNGTSAAGGISPAAEPWQPRSAARRRADPLRRRGARPGREGLAHLVTWNEVRGDVACVGAREVHLGHQSRRPAGSAAGQPGAPCTWQPRGRARGRRPASGPPPVTASDARGPWHWTQPTS